jgi:(p)ppGpp synthase/HD superfamily hydrolase
VLKLRSIRNERKARIESMAIEEDVIDRSFVRCVKKYHSESDMSKLLTAYDFAKQIKYTLSGFSNTAYFVHPVRVACLVMQLIPKVDLDTITIALLHNVLEVSALTFTDLKRRFNSRVAGSIKLLTVDRTCQKSKTYKSRYYKRLNSSFRGARIVKVLDKLDNLFLICINTDDNIRKSYLKEIEDYIIPLVDRDLTALSCYYRKLVKDCRKIGYFDLNKI